MTRYNYRHKSTKETEGLFDLIIDYVLDVPCVSHGAIVPYIFRLYRYAGFMYITDIFPAEYEGKSDCFKRFISHEGKAIDMQQLTLNCVQLFVDEFISRAPDSVMVVSGSYQDGESGVGQSRKLRIYRYALRDMIKSLNLRVVDLFEHNAFFLLDGGSTLGDKHIVDTYLDFKKQQR